MKNVDNNYEKRTKKFLTLKTECNKDGKYQVLPWESLAFCSFAPNTSGYTTHSFITYRFKYFSF